MIIRIVVTGLVIAALGLSACGRKGPLQAPPAPPAPAEEHQQKTAPLPQPKP